MLRPLTIALAAATLFFQASIATDALARGGVAARGIGGQVYGYRMGVPQFNGATGTSSRPRLRPLAICASFAPYGTVSFLAALSSASLMTCTTIFCLLEIIFLSRDASSSVAR